MEDRTVFKEHEAIHQKLDYFISTNNIPHIIFYGSSGSGKRTILYDFLNQIYKGDKSKIKSNVMFVNCSYGKGIKFIREDLKFFAKTNIQFNAGISFKSIVLLNADNLTMDAQSALRRSIELFSHNTRFFIVVENKHKLLNPILSRFCEIYIPEVESATSPGKYVNLYKMKSLDFMPLCVSEGNIRDKGCSHLNDTGFKENSKYSYLKEQIDTSLKTPVALIELCNALYNQGYSSLDIVGILEEDLEENINILVCFEKIKSEIRCEKLLMYYLFDFMYLREFPPSLKDICFI